MTTQPQQTTISAHPSHWYDIFNVILQAVIAGNTVLGNAKVIPAPIESGIQIGLVTAPIVAGTVETIQEANQPIPAKPGGVDQAGVTAPVS